MPICDHMQRSNFVVVVVVLLSCCLLREEMIDDAQSPALSNCVKIVD